jgi:hypothetical protein
MGADEAAINFGREDRMICDYSAVIQNPFNFNVTTGKRIEIYGENLFDIFNETLTGDVEGRFALSRVRNIY